MNCWMLLLEMQRDYSGLQKIYWMLQELKASHYDLKEEQFNLNDVIINAINDVISKQ